ncbi:hypothetical protein JIN82_01380 [Persicirhabdus sediminis]|uniref:Transcriptional regulator MraZ n=1 Tax=Persicirhabdus sediminis TaxID=454144 RepID=A0A8J7SKH9_9BACT|nr:hypothetical protein [Persicirhabdus sediminis]
MLEHSLEGVFDHKLDPKCRVSVPADWRMATSGTLRLLHSSCLEIPTIKVLTETEFEGMVQAIDELEGWSTAQKRQYRGKLFASCLKVSVGTQGKMLIPKACCERFEIEPGGEVVLVGRGAYFEIYQPSKYEEVLQKEDKALEGINDELGFF